jgi:hypothetical protein
MFSKHVKAVQNTLSNDNCISIMTETTFPLTLLQQLMKLHLYGNFALLSVIGMQPLERTCIPHIQTNQIPTINNAISTAKLNIFHSSKTQLVQTL